ncbi:hypothetical protein LOD99_15293 [Oopsacas minuta]|uniref:Uncharacterized protein n=1 Tax=Oopsacas minuta TaxID=111878 RepID=A0AAV7KC98_9METZ|nr:hypothetical protein LOD99_15293 [Oopsacas minuta]
MHYQALQQQQQQQQYQNNIPIRYKTPEINPRIREFASNEKFLRRSPSLDTRPEYINLRELPLHIHHPPKEVHMNSERGYLANKPKAITPPEFSKFNHFPPASPIRSNTPDGRHFRTNEHEILHNLNPVHPIQIQQHHNQCISPLGRKDARDAYQLANNERTIEILKDQSKQDKREMEKMRREIENLHDCIGKLSIENYQAKNLLEQETEENSKLSTQLARTNLELAELREKHLVSRRAVFEFQTGQVRNHDNRQNITANMIISPEHMSAIRGYNNKVEEMERKLWEKNQELNVMKMTCEIERKEKMNYSNFMKMLYIS